MKGLVLLSGGIDSTTCLALALQECEHVEAISFLYGQKHVRELTAAENISTYFTVPYQMIRLPNIFGGFGSTLMDPDKVNPHLTYEELRESEGPSPTYVPYRNGNLLSLASTVALVKGLDLLYFGAHADDAHNWAYPDCTPEFIGAMANAVHIGSYMKLRLKTPLMWLDKASIIKLGAELDVPFDLTYSCYEGGELHCGLCPTCVARKEAFSLAGVGDPTKYEVENVPIGLSIS